MLNRLLKKRKLRAEAVSKAREGYSSWLEIARSNGWKAYEERVNRKIEIIKHTLESDTNLKGDELKLLQLALAVWREVQRIPRELESNAKSGGK